MPAPRAARGMWSWTRSRSMTRRSPASCCSFLSAITWSRSTLGLGWTAPSAWHRVWIARPWETTTSPSCNDSGAISAGDSSLRNDASLPRAGRNSQRGARTCPAEQCDPLISRKMARDEGQHLHQDEGCSDENAGHGDKLLARGGTDAVPGGTRRQPSQRGGDRTHLGDGDEDSLAKKHAERGREGHTHDRRVGSAVDGVDGARALRDQAAATEGEHQTRGGDEIRIEALQQCQQR